MAAGKDFGQKNQNLISGRIAYGYDGTDARPFYANSTGTAIKKTIETDLFLAQDVAASVIVKSSELALNNAKQTTVFIDHARSSTVAWGASGGTNYLIQASEAATGDDKWRTLATFVAGSAVCSSAISAGTAAPGVGASTITITSGTAFVANDLVCWVSATTTNTEWVRVIGVSGTATFTILDPLVHAQGSTVVCYNQAEHFAVTLDTGSLTRLRTVINNTAGTTSVIRSHIAAITES
jgi:hypothetical protein